MTLEEQDRKLALIAALSAREITGWREEIACHADRPFPGELAALASREKQLGAK